MATAQGPYVRPRVFPRGAHIEQDDAGLVQAGADKRGRGIFRGVGPGLEQDGAKFRLFRCKLAFPLLHAAVKDVDSCHPKIVEHPELKICHFPPGPGKDYIRIDIEAFFAQYFFFAGHGEHNVIGFRLKVVHRDVYRARYMPFKVILSVPHVHDHYLAAVRGQPSGINNKRGFPSGPGGRWQQSGNEQHHRHGGRDHRAVTFVFCHLQHFLLKKVF